MTLIHLKIFDALVVVITYLSSRVYWSNEELAQRHLSYHHQQTVAMVTDIWHMLVINVVCRDQTLRVLWYVLIRRSCANIVFISLYVTCQTPVVKSPIKALSPCYCLAMLKWQHCRFHCSSLHTPNNVAPEMILHKKKGGNLMNTYHVQQIMSKNKKQKKTHMAR